DPLSGSIRARVVPSHRAVIDGRQLGSASAFPGLDVPMGAVAWGGRRAARSTNVLPLGPASTAWCNALPSRSSDQLRNQTVQPSPHVPARGLPVIVTGSPGTASLWEGSGFSG